MGSRTLPTECEHGVVVDFGDFGPCDDCNEHELGDCPNFQTCDECESNWKQHDHDVAVGRIRRLPLAERIAACFPDAHHVAPKTVYIGWAHDRYETTWSKDDSVRRFVIVVTEPADV